jgi:hypothetical protein
VPLPVVLPPFDDEWLGHWLFRIANFYGMSLPAFLERIPGTVSLPPGICWWHRLEEMRCEPQAISDYLRLPPEALLAMQFALLPVRCRLPIERSFCPQCLVDDCRHESVPYWRIHWLDLANTWCSAHQQPLEAADFLPRIIRRPYDVQVLSLRLRALSAEPHFANYNWPADWHAVLARQAQRHADGIRSKGPVERTILIELTERLAGIVLHLCRYDDCQENLATIIGAQYPDRLRLPPRSRRSRGFEADGRDSVSAVRSGYVRSWLLGVVAGIALIGQRSDAIGDGSLRQWLWRHLFAFHAPDLVKAFAPALRTGLIAPWPALQTWRPPSNHRDWFRPLTGDLPWPNRKSATQSHK